MNGFNFGPETWLPYLQVFADALQWTAWPLTAFFLALLFKKPASELIGRLKNVYAGSGRAEFELQQNLTVPSLSEKISLKSENCEAAGEKRNRFLPSTDAQRILHEKLSDDLLQIPDAEQKNALLMALTLEKICRHFAMAYADIFGSQIQALELLNQRQGSISLEDGREEFRKLQGVYPVFDGWTFERYILFLKNFGFIENDGSTVTLTSLGKDFILWLDFYGLSKERPL